MVLSSRDVGVIISVRFFSVTGRDRRVILNQKTLIFIHNKKYPSHFGLGLFKKKNVT